MVVYVYLSISSPKESQPNLKSFYVMRFFKMESVLKFWFNKYYILSLWLVTVGFCAYQQIDGPRCCWRSRWAWFSFLSRLPLRTNGPYVSSFPSFSLDSSLSWNPRISLQRQSQNINNITTQRTHAGYWELP